MASEPEDFVVREGLDMIRHTARLYFHEGRPTEYELLNFVTHDLLRAEVSDARFQRMGNLYAVSSAEDWMVVDGFSVEQLFARIVAPPPPPSFSWRGESMLAAFCSGVITSGSNGDFSANLRAEDLPDQMRLAIKHSARFLAWRFG